MQSIEEKILKLAEKYSKELDKKLTKRVEEMRKGD